MRDRKSEKGQTLVLVAISLLTLLSFAALAIDLTALYGVRAEMQRAADAAALAAGHAMVYSGTTTAPADTNMSGLATSMGTAFANAVLPMNKVGGVVPTMVSGPTFDFSRPGDPQVSVTLQRTDVPLFFAHVFGRRFATVRATATAEAYNSSNPPGGAGANMPPVAPSCVKPWFVVNLDPKDHGSGANKPFINPDGTLAGIAAGGAWTGTNGSGVIGEEIQINNLFSSLAGLLGGVIPNPGYLPAKLASLGSSCTVSCAGGSNTSQSVACCDTTNTYSCGTVQNMYVDVLANGLTGTLDGLSCLLEHGGGGGASNGLDTMDLGNFQTSRGADPLEITSGTGAHFGQKVSTSPQIVTVPIIDTTLLGGLLGQVKVDGFMQAFVERTDGAGAITMIVMNISGCGPNVNASATPVSGGGVSPVPVRLISQ